MKIAGQELHAACVLMPEMQGEEFASLVASIRERGLEHPIVTYEGKILDGRNRLRACKEAGVAPRFESWRGEGSPWRYAWEVNSARRHLDKGQRVTLALLFEQESGRWEAKRAEAKKGNGRRTDLAAKLPSGSPAPQVRDALAASAGVSARTAQSAITLQKSAPALFDRVVSGDLPLHKAITEVKRQERVDRIVEVSKGNAPITGELGRFPVIYADPPWRYEHVATESRAIENQYPTMDLDSICALPVQDIATEDAILFMWATSPKLAEAMRVVEAWGFVYRTCMVWVKDKIGMGYYARQKHELLLIATRGNPPTPPPAARPASVVEAVRGEHSAKPPEFYGLIETMYPEFARVELFCRSPRDGWKAWGNQAA